MYIAYIDETGDDGYPNYSSEIFVLTAIYLHHQEWRAQYDRFHEFRKLLNRDFRFPVKLELHAKKFILNKNPYRDFNWSDDQRIELIDLFTKMISGLNAKIINVAIVKGNITSPDYSVLDNALTYLVQRIENDLSRIAPPHSFMAISDPGRIGKMRKTTRRIQRINFIPSKIHQGSYRQEIKLLIEDPLQKDSKESYFIQIADLVSYFVYNYTLSKINKPYGSRVPVAITELKIKEWLGMLKPVLNLKASTTDEFGVVTYPNPKK